jgi:hypothetical protein
MPSGNFAGGNVFYDGQVNETIAKRNVGDIGAENLARSDLSEFSVQFIFKGSMLGRLFHDRFVGIFSPDLGDEAVFFHYPAYLFMVHDRVRLPFQMHFYLAPAVFLLALIEYLFDQQVVGMILVRVALLRYPPVAAATRNLGDIAAKPDVFIQRPDDPVFLARP